MRRWLAASIVLFAAVGFVLTGAPRAAAQGQAAEEESFLTADGVLLKGVFHATDKNPGSAPVVVLLYPPGPDRDMTKGDWVGLAKALNKEGYHVFRFDWRGHVLRHRSRVPEHGWRWRRRCAGRRRWRHDGRRKWRGYGRRNGRGGVLRTGESMRLAVRLGNTEGMAVTTAMQLLETLRGELERATSFKIAVDLWVHAGMPDEAIEVVFDPNQGRPRLA